MVYRAGYSLICFDFLYLRPFLSRGWLQGVFAAAVF